MGNVIYKCLTCGGDLQFSAETQNWTCKYCDDVFTLEQLDAAGKNELNEEKVDKHQELEGDKSQYQSTDGTVGSDLVQYRCSHCGAEIITDRATAATICVYCSNPVIMTEQVIGDFKPEYVIPFKIDKSKVMNSFKEFSKKPLTPKDFDCDKVVDKIQGVYIPFWLYSGTLTGSIKADGINKRRHRSGDYEITESHHHNVFREGSLSFEKVPVDASKKTEDAAMDSIEPYDFKEMVPFNIGYLAGYLAERFDEDKDTCINRASERIVNTGRDELVKTCQYDDVNVQQYLHKLDIEKTEYALLPTWLLYTKYKDKDYFFAMNGQTGKFIGNLPIDYLKLCLFTGIPSILIFVLLLFLL